MGETISEIYTRLAGEGRLEADPAQMAVLPELQRIRAALETAPARGGLKSLFAKKEAAPRGLYLWGGVGTGKSMLMDLFHAAVDIEEKRRVHFHAFMQDIQAGLHEARKTGVDDTIKPVAEKVISEIRLLSFDEMQITDIADAMIVGRLFEKLFDAGVVVVATSNREPGDLYKDGLNRQIFLPFIDLIRARMEVRELASPRDYRLDRLQGETVYFTPANAEARHAVSQMWEAMAGGAGSPLRLPMKGRVVEVPEFRNGVGRATFWDLCAKPLGPGDYLAIADALRVLILEDIPLLSSENYNEAKRFVTLIDALYEAKVRLIATAADEPERLYLEGEGTFEFARTASRLREMQSENWATDA
ncbi:cell division protein ZapE [Ovoidimarina sediminis]|uniref:cell division protein ZapE n=1 Tax=Ovoidimarina sediminis TaxID=3079856 RepID=UPI00291134FC|nr:cell division protein ZapE [Rhodophyticola sp. MJ-SS7]MDU8944465.1 cell division protein ZapE [Rhodophyticola sp. MJ-SS7]